MPYSPYISSLLLDFNFVYDVFGKQDFIIQSNQIYLFEACVMTNIWPFLTHIMVISYALI